MSIFYKKRAIKRRVIKFLAVFALMGILNQLLFPTVAYALTSGPAQPEFSSFEPVATTNMVNEFSGDFTYNLPVLEVPGPQGSGYSMSLSYHGGSSPEEESSWLGFGWTMNAGSICRTTRGFPDDYNGKDITYHNKVPNNWTVTAGAGAVFEILSIDAGVAPRISASIRYNNYKGFGYNAGLGIVLGKGAVNLGYNVSDGQGSFSLSVNPAAALNTHKELKEKNKNNSKQAKPSVEKLKTDWAINQYRNSQQHNKFQLGGVSLLGSQYGVFNYGSTQSPSHISSYVGESHNMSFGLLGTPSPLPLGVSGNIFGSFTRQVGKDSKTLQAYGYMYSENADDKDAIMDYFVEKESPYEKRDVFLGIPFNNADNYTVTGEGMGGGFRMYNKKMGQFRPNKVVSPTIVSNFSYEVELGFNVGLGGDAGIGFSTLTVSDWKETLSKFKKENNQVIDEQTYFRFNNDLGGSITHPTGDGAIQAGIVSEFPALPLPPGKLKFIPYIDHIKHDLSNEKRNGRSSYIAYHTNQQIFDAKTTRYGAYSLRADLDAFVPRNKMEIKDGYGEIVTFNETGSRYIYGLPVYSKGEKNLQYGVKGASSTDIVNNYVSYYKNEDIKVGEERKQPYANSFLLTEITTPDYVDRNLDGPTQDDFGGYTRFNYERHIGGINNVDTDNWYKWRFPYNGLMYHKNSLSNPFDDMVSISEGEKEIYYLKSIETKTHVAIFNTSARNDGMEASDDVTARSGKGAQGLKKLNYIQLYVITDLTKESGEWKPKNAQVKPIKTVQFRYNEDLCKGLPNASSGKLTLKQVWFEYEGISESKISPYVFEYNYPDYSKYPSRYQSLKDQYSELTTDEQNPDYSPYTIDAWGNYQPNDVAMDRYAKMQTWLDQNPDYTSFDPAAYQLKVIKLPSGGEIHVQYEQDDYSYVQNQAAHVMTSIKSYDGNKKFYLNTDEIGVTSEADLLKMKEMIQKQYEGKSKIYFKFLYRLLNSGIPEIKDCNAEYIDGFVDIKKVDIDGQGLYLQLENEDRRLPVQVCRDFVKTERLGNIRTGSCDASSTDLDDSKDPIELTRQLLRMAQTIIVPSLCMSMNGSLSYFRVPTPLSKKGGGLRVKRLLMFDPNDGVLYGNEYDYRVLDKNTGTIRSSGVATNEPAAIHDENALDTLILRKHQSLASKVIAGKDKKQTEGPIGESVMPGASVGYGRVTVKNIHSGITNPGYTVKEFYTAYDYPVQMKLTPISRFRDYVPLPGSIVNIFVNSIWATQGFSFILNNMHGQIKRVATYGGNYNDIPDTKTASPSSEQIYEYFNTGETIPQMDRFGGKITYGSPGKEVDITFAQSRVKDELFDISVEVDGDVGFFGWFPIPFVSGMPSLTHNRTEMHTHATSKVVRYPAIVKKIRSTQDGVTHITENLAFDEYTGRPVAVRSYDDHEGAYLAQEIPVSWEYESMGSKATNEGMIIPAVAGKLSIAYVGGAAEYLRFTGSESCSKLSSFSRGDVLSLPGGYIYHVESVDYGSDALRIVKSWKSISKPKSTISYINILRSGRTNQLSGNAGSVTFHSTDSKLPVPEFEQSEYTSNNFTTDLNAALTGRSGQGTFFLDGIYTDYNISNFINELPAGCVIDQQKATISKVEFKYVIDANQIDLSMVSFRVKCNGASNDVNSWPRVGAAEGL